jgi:hypothetical protein
MKKCLAVLALILLSACAPATPSDPSTDRSGQHLEPVTSVETSLFPAESYWHPAPGDSFQIQFSGDLDLSTDARIYDIDLFDSDPALVEQLHARGSRVLCYISVGSWEDWRPDADQFPPEVIGNDYEGWPGEKWLDIRRLDLLAPILRARLDLCAVKGFDGVEPDNVEVYDNDTGFSITYADQLAFAIWLADEAHARGLAIGLKNAPDMIAEAQPYFDFSVAEDCFYYSWCTDTLPFIEAGKPVFAIEYTDMDIDFETACMKAKSLGLTMLLKHRNLDAFLQVCP